MVFKKGEAPYPGFEKNLRQFGRDFTEEEQQAIWKRAGSSKSEKKRFALKLAGMKRRHPELAVILQIAKSPDPQKGFDFMAQIMKYYLKAMETVDNPQRQMFYLQKYFEMSEKLMKLKFGDKQVVKAMNVNVNMDMTQAQIWEKQWVEYEKEKNKKNNNSNSK